MVSRLCLGTMNFGPQTDEPAARSIMDSALEAGINFFDPANVYGGEEHRGWTEEILDRWFASRGERIHHVDRDTPWDEIWQAIEVAVQQGRSYTPGAVTSPAGTSPKRRRLPPGGATPARSVSSPTTTCSPARLSSK